MAPVMELQLCTLLSALAAGLAADTCDGFHGASHPTQVATTNPLLHLETKALAAGRAAVGDAWSWDGPGPGSNSRGWTTLAKWDTYLMWVTGAPWGIGMEETGWEFTSKGAQVSLSSG